MRTLSDHIENIKSKPHHVRKKITFTLAGTGAGLVGLVWLGTSLASGAFAIKGATFAESTGQGATVETVTKDPNANLAGAAAAVKSDTTGPARIQIVNVVATSTVKEKPEQTTISF